MKIFAKPTCSCSSHDTCTIEESMQAAEGAESCCTNDHHNHNTHDTHSHDDHGHSHPPSSLTPREEALFLAVCTVFFFTVLIVEHFFGQAIPASIIQVLYLIPYIVCGYPILREGAERIAHKDVFNEFTLMGIASLVAILLGQTAEAVGVMLFYRIGEHIQERAAGSSRKNIEKLLATKPTQACIIEDGVEKIVDVEQVQIGQHIRVRAGEKIPLDGVIVSGISEIDQSPLTGESLPVSVKTEDTVIGGAINLTGALTIAVHSTFANSHMAKILAMVEEAAKRKSPTERFITRFARYYTPAVVGIAFLVAIVPPLLIPDATFRTWIYRALVMLVISCPCALLISIPLGYFGGIGAASRNGILVKGGNVFDEILKTSAVVFDKTGTLTHGKFSVSAITPAEGVSADTLLFAAGIAELQASHPIARAIMQHIEETKTVPPFDTASIQSYEEAGKGMRVTHEGSTYLAGTKAFLEENNIPVTVNTAAGAIVYVACDAVFLGSILVSDTIKQDSAEAIANLNKKGLDTIMLTGDREESAAQVAKAIGIQHYRSGLLPDGKIESLKEMTPLDSAIFVGDGINDAPILSMVRVGVAMGEIGSEVAIEAADVVLLNDSPKLIEKLFGISASVRNIVWQNIIFALGIKIIIMGFGIAGLSGLWEAIFADVGVALLAVLNSTRIVYMNRK